MEPSSEILAVTRALDDEDSETDDEQFNEKYPECIPEGMSLTPELYTRTARWKALSERLKKELEVEWDISFFLLLDELNDNDERDIAARKFIIGDFKGTNYDDLFEEAVNEQKDKWKDQPAPDTGGQRYRFFQYRRKTKGPPHTRDIDWKNPMEKSIWKGSCTFVTKSTGLPITMFSGLERRKALVAKFKVSKQDGFDLLHNVFTLEKLSKRYDAYTYKLIIGDFEKRNWKQLFNLAVDEQKDKIARRLRCRPPPPQKLYNYKRSRNNHNDGRQNSTKRRR